MKLIWIELTNFKCHRNLKVNFSESKTTISGSNGTGKTTIADAFFWLLTGKDSAGRTDVTFRPLNVEGQLIHDIDVCVSAKFELNERNYCLTRKYHENWTLNKKSGDKIFKGNSTLYSINDVPKSESAWDAWIEEKIPAKVFAMTSDPIFVPRMPWKDQRKLVLEVAGDITVTSIFKDKPELAPLEPLLAETSIDDLAIAYKNKLKPVKKELEEIPVRIDQESKDLMAEDKIHGLLDGEQVMLSTSQKTLSDLLEQKAAAAAGDHKAVIKERVKALEAKLESIRTDFKQRRSDVSKEYDQKNLLLSKDIEKVSKEKILETMIVQRLSKSLEDAKNKVNKLVTEFTRINSATFHEYACPTCHRPFDPDKLEQFHTEFNETKADNLKTTIIAGTEAKKQYEDYKAKLEESKVVLADLEDQGSKLIKASSDLGEARSAAIMAVTPIEDHPEYFITKNQLDADLSTINAPEKANSELNAKIETAQKSIDESNNLIAQYNDQLRRWNNIHDIADKKQLLRVQADEFNDVLNMIKEFNLIKIGMVDHNINKTFPGLEFKLFSRNITNDDIRETCELTMHGVPYRDLSTGEKIQAGMIIVNVLSTYFKVNNPKFIDNAESITLPIKASGQTILMKAVDNQKLKVEA